MLLLLGDAPDDADAHRRVHGRHGVGQLDAVVHDGDLAPIDGEVPGDEVRDADEPVEPAIDRTR